MQHPLPNKCQILWNSRAPMVAICNLHKILRDFRRKETKISHFNFPRKGNVYFSGYCCIPFDYDYSDKWRILMFLELHTGNFMMVAHHMKLCLHSVSKCVNFCHKMCHFFVIKCTFFVTKCTFFCYKTCDSMYKLWRKMSQVDDGSVSKEIRSCYCWLLLCRTITAICFLWHKMYLAQNEPTTKLYKTRSLGARWAPTSS